MRGGNVFLEILTSVGHSSSGGKPITLKGHGAFNETGITLNNYAYYGSQFMKYGSLFMLCKESITH